MHNIDACYSNSNLTSLFKIYLGSTPFLIKKLVLYRYIGSCEFHYCFRYIMESCTLFDPYTQERQTYYLKTEDSCAYEVSRASHRPADISIHIYIYLCLYTFCLPLSFLMSYFLSNKTLMFLHIWQSNKLVFLQYLTRSKYK